MNRIDQLFQTKSSRILSIYFCAGCPTPDGTAATIQALQDAGVDIIEIGIPFSDPLADGPVIQQAATTALRNGMSLRRLFDQLADIRRTVHIPLLLMGYLNPILQFGFESSSSASKPSASAAGRVASTASSSLTCPCANTANTTKPRPNATACTW